MKILTHVFTALDCFFCPQNGHLNLDSNTSFSFSLQTALHFESTTIQLPIPFFHPDQKLRSNFELFCSFTNFLHLVCPPKLCQCYYPCFFSSPIAQPYLSCLYCFIFSKSPVPLFCPPLIHSTHSFSNVNLIIPLP